MLTEGHWSSSSNCHLLGGWTSYSRNGWNCPRYGHASGKPLTIHHTISNSKPNNRLTASTATNAQQIQQQQMQQAQPVQQMQQAQLVQQMQRSACKFSRYQQVQPVQQVPHVATLGAPQYPVYTPAPPIAAAPVNTPSVATIPAPLPQIRASLLLLLLFPLFLRPQWLL